MYLKYEFVTVGNEQELWEAEEKLSRGYDFAYSPFLVGEQKLFRAFPDFVGSWGSKIFLLFKYVPEDVDGEYKEMLAAQDINAGLEYLGVVGLESALWEWKTCSDKSFSWVRSSENCCFLMAYLIEECITQINN